MVGLNISRAEVGLRAAQVIVGVAGAFYTATGAALLFAPAWFFRVIGPYAPFNRHYEGDLGAFLLPLGVALLVVARAPGQHRLLLWMAAAASLLHAANHTYDSLVSGASAAHWLVDTLPLVVFALALVWAGITPAAAGVPGRQSQ